LQTEFQSAWPLHKTFRQALGYRLLRAFGLDRLYRLAMVLQGYRNPLAAILKVTSHCNLRCRHCPWHDNQTLQLATDEWRAIIDRAWQVGCDSLILEGGEPTTRRDLQQLIEHARTLGMAVHFITNGTRPLDSYRPHSVIISLQGPQKEHDAIVGAPVFERIIENCMAIPDVPKVVLCTVSPANVHVLEEFVALVHGWVDGIWFNFYYPYRTSSEEPLRDELRRDAAETLVALKRRFPKIMNSTKGLRYIADKRGRLYCDPWYTLNVHFDGRYVHHCTVSFYEEPDCANCYQTCYVEPYLALRLNPASIRFFRMLKGLGRAAAS
jgi:MoaA/NifB/PqqE/SkfB family radical SAM enzyme